MSQHGVDASRLNPEPALDQLLQEAIAHHQSGRLAQAESLYREILRRDPRHVDALHLLGVIAYQVGRLDNAAELIRQAINLRPDFPDAYSNLGNIFKDKGQIDHAISAYRMAIACNPDIADVHYNLGVALKIKGQLEEAIAAHRLAIALEPRFTKAHFNLGNALADSGNLEQAIAAYRQAIALEPNLAEAHGNLAVALLLAGNMPEGWAEYEWRWKIKDFRSPRRNFTQPQWNGEDLAQRTILLHAEQALGDTILLVRYLPMVAHRAGNIVLECQPELNRLLNFNARGWQVISAGQPLPEFDVHCPLLSLPRALGTTLQTIPGQPYLRADKQGTELWHEKVAKDSSSIKVGLVWAGSGTLSNDARSVNLATLAPLAALPGIHWYSLQKGPGATQAKNPPAGLELIDWKDQFQDFADTAALIANLDLVISVDTAVAHLAGAMGRPVWVLLSTAMDWRWMLQRQDSPWYPTMRLFRQSKCGQWDDVVQRVKESLARLTR
jgi:tetratricopeptide (TPR) repeat protein